MKRKVSTLDIRQNLGDILNRVALRHDEYVIERKGKPGCTSSSTSNRCTCPVLVIRNGD